MDKYTVDLDKVLNDFEYSEYSIESAKLNRNLQEEIPNTSFNANYPKKNDATVKHSINNVFHSLNEYLSSDITPKKLENVQKTQENIYVPKDSYAASFLGSTHTFLPHINSQMNIGQKSVGNDKCDSAGFHVSIDKEDNFQAFSDNLVEKTDILSSINNVHYSNKILQGISQNNVEKSTENFESHEHFEFETKKFELPEEEVGKIIEEPSIRQITEHFTEPSNECENEEMLANILVDLGSSIDSICGNERDSVEINLNANEEELIIENAEIPTPIKIEDIISKTDESDLTNEESNGLLIEEKKESQIEKVGFEENVDLDEEKLDQYFQELEKELGISEEEVEDFDGQHIKNEMEETTMNSEEIGITPLKNENEVQVELKNEEVVAKLEEEKSISVVPVKEKELSESKFADTVSQSISAEKEVSKPMIEEREAPIMENEVTELLDRENTLQEIMKDKEVLNESKNSEKLEGISIHPEEENHESEKHDRPQNLMLSEKTQETSREINLIGEPGSTPYNNVYSTKDFEKNCLKEEGSGEKSSIRPVSPTYSDVSTDSVSSDSSDDAEYNDAVSEIHCEKKEKQNDGEIGNTNKDSDRETIQNNMISSGDICRSDIKIDKAFKNNLKTSNLEEMGEGSRPNIQMEENVESCNKNEIVEGTPSGNEEASTNDLIGTETLMNSDERSDMEGLRLEEPTTSLGVDWLGKQAPLWIPDNEATSCLHCDMKFTVIKRRHHCRACGLVLCSKCCNLKYRLEYLDAEARVCKKCYDILNKDTNSSSGSEISQESSSPSRSLNPTRDRTSLGQPNPNNPLEYCSTIPPLQQVDPGTVATPSVMVPVGVLKRKGSNKGRSNKSVMFCDGIRPGSDLTNLDTDFNYSDRQKAEKSRKSPEKSGKIGKNVDMLDHETRSFIPSDEKSLPPTVTIFKSDIKFSPCANNTSVVEMLKNEPLIFALQSNVFIHVKIINLDCCVNRMAWCFSTEGLINVGQDEIVILLEFIENEPLVPKEIFIHLNNIYLEAVKGSSVKELGLSLHTSTPFLGSKNHAGFVYIRPTFQCLQNVILPKEPYLVGVLIHRWETPWAKLFPLRLVLRLGAEYKYYPSPIISTRERDSVFVEIGHTIINLLADFRNFSYTLPQIRGLTIHMEDKNTTVTIPVNRYDQVLKGLCNSSDHILAFAGNFSTKADSHLVCIQDTQSTMNNYSTHAINICNQPRKVTGASFIVFNGALKSTSGLTAKSNIVEDGLMIQILPEHMLQIRESLRNMKNHTIKCGCVNEESDETVTIVWGESDSSFNVGVLSPIDNKAMTGVPSIRVHNGKDYTCNSGSRLIRWTEVFIIQSGEESSRNQDPVDISKISENVAKATCQALVKYLDLLVSNSFYKIGLRANLHVENVSYSAGSNNVKLPPIYMKSLDNELIPVLHRITSNNITEQPIILELIFRILNI